VKSRFQPAANRSSVWRKPADTWTAFILRASTVPLFCIEDRPLPAIAFAILETNPYQCLVVRLLSQAGRGARLSLPVRSVVSPARPIRVPPPVTAHCSSRGVQYPAWNAAAGRVGQPYARLCVDRRTGMLAQAARRTVTRPCAGAAQAQIPLARGGCAPVTANRPPRGPKPQRSGGVGKSPRIRIEGAPQ